ncbi:unnamed protein product [Caenorhabditis auriculariae]|uniref:Inhibitor of growth protein n=1 Tax=Caenorhabditis auriculariae TaxID=2777116 RepID=A0A8S1GNT0_9PELO|nr:unnamed protein product [Caenorhabditis auriculariae]
MANLVKACLTRVNDEIPPLIRLTLKEMESLDGTVNRRLERVAYLKKKLLQNYRKMNPKQKKAAIDEIRSCHRAIGKYSNQKITLANQLYEKVDARILHMDRVSAKFNAFALKRLEETRRAKKIQKENENKQTTDKKSEETPVKSDSGKPQINPGTDMPMDPNEPVYCICRQVSYGQMVACDGKNCSTEWFHFACVGVTEAPKGRWYCEECKARNPRRKKQAEKKANEKEAAE